MANNQSYKVKFFSGEEIPLELHKVRIVQKLNLIPIEDRLKAIVEGGFNTFLLTTKTVFLDMLTDSGTNAMSDNQVASMLRADDAYAGSQSYLRLEEVIQQVFNCKYYLPVHQGRAAENIISKVFIKPGDVVPMNYHFTTTKAHIEINGGTILEIYTDEALKVKSSHPFKGNLDIAKLKEVIKKYGAGKVAYVRLEASTNLIGGQPFSIANMREVRKVAKKHGLMVVLDASLIGENAYFIKQREPEFKNKSIKEILHEMIGLVDLTYFSSRKVSSTRGGGICTNSLEIHNKMKDLVPLFEGFYTYGGMSIREVEAMAIGLVETLDETIISQSPLFIRFMVKRAGAARGAGGDAGRGPGRAHRCGAVPVARAADRVSRGRAGVGVLPHFRCARHGARDHLQRARCQRQRCAGGHRAAAPGDAAARVHALAGQVRDRPAALAV